MPMRVIAGIYRHRKLEYPENNPSIRPTKDRIREAFFSSLGDIEGKTFLDLYAGCGSMGIEAISRGASKVIFVDYDNEPLKYVRKNIASLNIEDKCEVIKSLDLEALKTFIYQNRKFDIVYLDPPYDSGLYDEALRYIFENDLLSDCGIVAIESNHKIEINPLWKVRIKEYHYGEIQVVVLRK